MKRINAIKAASKKSKKEIEKLVNLDEFFRLSGDIEETVFLFV